MKKAWITIGLLLGVSALSYFGLRQVVLLKKTKFRVRRIRNIDAKGGVTSIVYDLEIANQSRIEMTMKNLSIDIYSANRKIGDVRYAKPFVVPAEGVANIPLETELNSLAILGAVKGGLSQLLTASSIDLVFKISVDVKAYGLTMNKLKFDTIKQFTL